MKWEDEHGVQVRIWKEMVVACLKVVSQHSLGET